ncbi:L,D-transpeptidase family protein [Otariodibacter sp.]|uniref:L,D-transpeptidase family protein n=1 Tax=Otariodibacter sp. TaxID=3030919 RepID=UPI0026151FE0|nr:L,D-transpeptidase family protein [Otariodibacter sp.]
MKKLKYFPLVILSSSITFSIAAIASDNVLSQLSFKVQQNKTLELMENPQNTVQQEEDKQLAASQLIQAQQRIQQEVGNNQLLLSKVIAQVYLENQFIPLWKDKTAEKIFLKEYAVFAESGISKKSATALKQILSMSSGLARDILLTDSFLDYLYYTKNVSKFANEWLYDLGSYRVKAPSNDDVNHWISMIKAGYAAQFVADLVPRNHIYQETVNKMLEVLSSGTHSSVSAQSLALNAQRLRLIPSFSNGIFVNIPSYQLYYFRDGKLALKSRVIVGRADRRTPVMYSKLSNIVVNPPWNVPTSIKNKDLVPKMRRDPSYAEKHSYEIFDSKGNKVNPYNIDWKVYDNPKKNFPYRIRQKAGDDSALGHYKFNMPSSDAIYLHDTPNHGLFNRNMRALSSGCVRVAKSDELAMMLLKEAGWSEQHKNKVVQSKKTTSVRIKSDNPVYLYYVTAWVENGQIHTLPDIYKLDKKVSNASLDWAKLRTLI